MEVANKRAVGILVDHMRTGAAKTRAKITGPRDHEPDERVANFTLSYLDAFGYLTKELEQWKDISLGDIVEAVKDFQKMFGLRSTGKVCVKTVRAMEAPRCGCPDHCRDHDSNTIRIKQFVNANLARWQKDSLKYAITEYVPGVSKPDFESTMFNAFQAWTRYGNIEVQPTRTNQADIVIMAGRGRQSNFDGPGGTLAWAYLPNGNDAQLQMRFDLDETWILNPQMRGTLLFNVACHEFGHLFGLDHSKVQSALMAPYYNASIQVPQQNDDVPRFQARYGVKAAGGDGAVTPATPGDVAELVVRGRVDTVLLGGRKLV